MIEIVEINGAAVSMQGDFWETLVFVPAAEEHFLGEQDSLLQKYHKLEICSSHCLAFILKLPRLPYESKRIFFA